MPVPQIVASLRQRALDAGFSLSSEDATGELLSVLSAAVQPGGRILEIGTGMGVGLGWIVAGLGTRTDVSVTTIESDPGRWAAAQIAGWPAWVQFLAGDATSLLPRLGRFDLIFADAEGGKWYGLDLTLAALDIGGMLVLDDMNGDAPELDEIRLTISADRRLVATELYHATGILLAVRQS